MYIQCFLHVQMEKHEEQKHNNNPSEIIQETTVKNKCNKCDFTGKNKQQLDEL